VHYLRAGNGPPVVLIHSSPANAWLLIDIITLLAQRYTVFAPDTPGFGQSEPLPLADMTVADLADALCDTLTAMAMPPCPMFGTHTGAAIVLEFAHRHPHRVTGVVLDGVPVFTEAQYTALFVDYFRPIEISDLGGQYAMAWTRMRDQSVWFPWFSRSPEALNEYDLGAPESTHRWVSMYFDAAAHYVPAYRAALRYGEGASAAAAALHVPAIFTAADADMLYPHLNRMHPARADQEVRRPGLSPDANHAVIVEGFARFGSPGTAPPDQDEIVSSYQVRRHFINGRDGRQLHLRHAGRREAPPVLLLHDAPGSTAQLGTTIARLAQDCFVVAPDLPGCGESDRFAAPPAIADYTGEIIALLDRLGLEQIDVLGIGFGGTVAVDLARRLPARIRKLSTEGTVQPNARR
jgi:pimeloyl-ACP methyl ester carboxylesterase